MSEPGLEKGVRTKEPALPEAAAGRKRNLFAIIRDSFSAKFPDDFSIKQGRASVIAIAWPTMLESFLLHLVSMADTIMVGALGTWAISSVGYSNQPRLLIAAVFQAFNTGATALIARAKGAQNPVEANAVMHQAIMFSMSVSFILAALGYIFAQPLVMFMGASEEATIIGSTRYLEIIMLTFPANAFTLSITATLRGIGKTRFSMIYNVTANLVNVLVNFLLIEGRFGFPALGVRGAAIGTGAGYITAAVMAFISVSRGADILRVNFKKFLKIDFSVLRRVVRIGTPAMFEQLFMRTGNIMFSKVVASLGTDAFATHQIVMNIHQMTFMNGQSFGVSATSLLGQSLGRRRPDQGKAEVQLCRRYAMIISLSLAAGMVIFGRQLIALYADSESVIAMGATLLWIVALLQPLQSSQQVLGGALRGAGDTKALALCIFIGIVVIRPLVSAILVYVAGLELVGVWLALVLDQGMRSTFTMWRFTSDRWKTIKV